MDKRIIQIEFSANDVIDCFLENSYIDRIDSESLEKLVDEAGHLVLNNYYVTEDLKTNILWRIEQVISTFLKDKYVVYIDTDVSGFSAIKGENDKILLYTKEEAVEECSQDDDLGMEWAGTYLEGSKAIFL